MPLEGSVTTVCALCERTCNVSEADAEVNDAVMVNKHNSKRQTVFIQTFLSNHQMNLSAAKLMKLEMQNERCFSTKTISEKKTIFTEL